MKRLLLLCALSLVACDDGDKKKDLLEKTTPSATVSATVAPLATPAASSAAPSAKAMKPPKECTPGPDVTIDDPDLEAEIRLKADKPKDKNPTLKTSDLALVKSVNLARKNNVDDLDPCVFPKLTGMKDLFLGPGKLNDLRPISTLIQLESLRASINEVEDLKPLEKLTKLDRLDISKTHVHDISVLANLVNLTELQMDDIQITDLSPIAKLKKLEKLSIQNTPITDVSPLKDLTKLKVLTVKGTAISNLDTIQPLMSKGLKVVSK